MSKRMPLYRILYYVVFLLAFLGCLWLALWLASLYGPVSLGTAMMMVYGFVFICIPTGVAIFARLSLLRWYVDPFAAALVPVTLYFIMVIDKITITGGLWPAFGMINQSLIHNHGEGLLYFIGLFLFGLAASFSIARKEGRSIAFQWIEILESRGRKEENVDE